jgi:hypothetical protein
MVCGFRYNARVLAEHLAERRFGKTIARPRLEPRAVVPHLIRELNLAPELAMQKGYLARVVTVDGGTGIRDGGFVPLEVFVDGDGDGIAATLEFDADETIRPVLYARREGKLREIVLPPHPLRRYDALAYREAVTELVAPIVGLA